MPQIDAPSTEFACPDQWTLSPGVTYLNHGSWGPPPNPVRAARRQWLDLIEADPPPSQLLSKHSQIVQETLRQLVLLRRVGRDGEAHRHCARSRTEGRRPTAIAGGGGR